MKEKLSVRFGQPSWRLRTRNVEAFVTEIGGHLGPVTFRIGKKRIQPLAIAPWAEETTAKLPPMLKVLRGDFFCLPFGSNETPYEKECHPPHGETANAKWKFESRSMGNLHLSLKSRVRPGRVEKFIVLGAGHAAIYQRHVISGMEGPMNLGHHAMLKFPDRPGSGLVSTSRFLRGHVAPLPLENPELRGYSTLKNGAVFRSLERVPTMDGGWTDLSRYPARRGFEDLVLLESDMRQPFAWTAVTFPKEGYVWFALKDPCVLQQTILWISNGGRHYSPWNGQHVNVMGLEEVTSYFHYGLAESAARNPLAATGALTCLQMNQQNPLVVNYIMAVAPIPEGFERVAFITPLEDGRSVRLTSRNGKSVIAPLALEFLGGRTQHKVSSKIEL